MKKTNRKIEKPRRKSPAPRIAALLAVLLCAFFGWMHLQARVTHLRPAEVYLPDLPAAFDGTTLLYISDFKLQSQSDAAAAKRLMQHLSELQPDLLLLGGDYCANGAIDTLNGTKNDTLPDYAADFIASLSTFPAKLGKFAIAGDADGDLQSLAASFNAAGVGCLADSAAGVSKDGAQIYIAGITDPVLNRGGSARLSRDFRADQCVIALSHNPAGYKDIRVAEVPGGGAWADLVLSGHTLGGQISIFGRTLRSFSDDELRTLSGWFYPNDLPLLVSNGLGCDAVHLRLNSESQVHLITLHKQYVSQ